MCPALYVKHLKTIAIIAIDSGIGIAINDRLRRAETGSFSPDFPQHNKNKKNDL